MATLQIVEEQVQVVKTVTRAQFTFNSIEVDAIIQMISHYEDTVEFCTPEHEQLIKALQDLFYEADSTLE